MISVAVVGANGYVGSQLCAALSRDPLCALTRVTRADHEQMRERTFDVLVNAAMPAARFWAKGHPDEDFAETVKKTADLLYRWRFKKFVQLSTVSARCQLDTVYGRHKAAAEKICGFGDNLIVRLGPMYGPGLKRGVLIDMLEGKKVFVDGASRYCFAPGSFVSSWIAANLHRSGISEVGARNALTLREVADHLGAKVEFEGAVDHQEIPDPAGDFPDARDVLAFLDGLRSRQAQGDRLNA
jgi:nucleoside-diphosphate-sugar epimerase